MSAPTDWEALARRAVACKAWRWVPGMLTASGGRFGWVTNDPIGDLSHAHFFGPNVRGSYGPWGRCHVRDMAVLLPDLTDPATLGCMLALVREVWGRPTASVDHRTRPPGEPDGQPETYWILSLDPPRPWPPVTGDTEAEALVAALEAAP